MKLFNVFLVVVASNPVLSQSTSVEDASKRDLAAENILLWQRNNGGWPKDTYTTFFDDTKSAAMDPPKPGKKTINYAIEPTDEQKKLALATKHFQDATIDNGHTVGEIRQLIKAYKETGYSPYLEAAERGIEYLLSAQYPNGGWPQFYPDKRLYRHQITYNDNAMANVMNLMADIKEGRDETQPVNSKFMTRAEAAFQKGIEIMLKTQLVTQGKKTVWCAQYDEISLLPGKARSYELPSLSGSESVGIVRVLMRVTNPSFEIKQAVTDAIAWFEQTKITGYKVERVPDATMPSNRNTVLVPAEGSIIWARFYDLETNKPFFSDRDGIKKNTLAEVGDERRNGYAWYGVWPLDLINKEYPKWKEEVK